jgi:hypothetical protein
VRCNVQSTSAGCPRIFKFQLCAALPNITTTVYTDIQEHHISSGPSVEMATASPEGLSHTRPHSLPYGNTPLPPGGLCTRVHKVFLSPPRVNFSYIAHVSFSPTLLFLSSSLAPESEGLGLEFSQLIPSSSQAPTHLAPILDHIVTDQPVILKHPSRRTSPGVVGSAFFQVQQGGHNGHHPSGPL